MIGYRSRTTKPTSALWAFVGAALAVATGGTLLVLGLTVVVAVALTGGLAMRYTGVPALTRREERISHL